MMCGKLCQNVWPFQVGLIRGFRVIRLVYDMMHYLLQQYIYKCFLPENANFIS